mmetsp:Transcript_4694/g.13146  ORF Transcript_4694/g.13146 Transcript_4694/m.13146 type:complete len:295 (+) Transcript_4694:57-941(+)
MAEDNEDSESLERALADVEMLHAMYPEEITSSASSSTTNNDDPPTTTHFPLHVTLQLSLTARCDLELTAGYPTSSGVQIASYRCRPAEKARLERALTALRTVARECLEQEVEGCFPCTQAALEVWNDGLESAEEEQHNGDETNAQQPHDDDAATKPQQQFAWRTSEPFVVQKSTFQGHVCRITQESDVSLAMDQLLYENKLSSKLARASHNMMAYRVCEEPSGVWKSDNDEDGEDGAGSRLSHLLQVRNENGLLVVVSRWFGGILLGPKRFAHITNVARAALDEFLEQEQQEQQ